MVVVVVVVVVVVLLVVVGTCSLWLLSLSEWTDTCLPDDHRKVLGDAWVTATFIHIRGCQHPERSLQPSCGQVGHPDSTFASTEETNIVEFLVILEGASCRIQDPFGHIRVQSVRYDAPCSHKVGTAISNQQIQQS